MRSVRQSDITIGQRTLVNSLSKGWGLVTVPIAGFIPLALSRWRLDSTIAQNLILCRSSRFASVGYFSGYSHLRTGVRDYFHGDPSGCSIRSARGFSERR